MGAVIPWLTFLYMCVESLKFLGQECCVKYQSEMGRRALICEPDVFRSYARDVPIFDVIELEMAFRIYLIVPHFSLRLLLN